jgi:hypothetical protein
MASPNRAVLNLGIRPGHGAIYACSPGYCGNFVLNAPLAPHSTSREAMLSEK